jgi:transposase
MSANGRRRALASDPRQALVSKGPGGARCMLDAGRLRVLEAVSDAGPAVVGRSERCWTLARVAEVVRRRFGVENTLAGLDVLPHRIGWSVRAAASQGRRPAGPPPRRAAERDEEKIAAWQDEGWPGMKGRRRTWAPGSVSKARSAGAPAQSRFPSPGHGNLD